MLTYNSHTTRFYPLINVIIITEPDELTIVSLRSSVATFNWPTRSRGNNKPKYGNVLPKKELAEIH